MRFDSNFIKLLKANNKFEREKLVVWKCRPRQKKERNKRGKAVDQFETDNNNCDQTAPLIIVIIKQSNHFDFIIETHFMASYSEI